MESFQTTVGRLSVSRVTTIQLFLLIFCITLIKKLAPLSHALFRSSYRLMIYFNRFTLFSLLFNFPGRQ